MWICAIVYCGEYAVWRCGDLCGGYLTDGAFVGMNKCVIKSARC